MDIIKKIFLHFWKAWRRMSVYLRIPVILLFVLVLLSLVGLPKDLQETCEATVFTQSGEVLTCQVEARGALTRYPLRRKVDVDTLSVWSENRLVAEIPYVSNFSNRFTAVLDQEAQTFVAELDLKILFPDQESQRCVILLPTGSRETALEILNGTEMTAQMRENFQWFLENA